MKFIVQHNTLMSYHTALHVSVRMNHHQALLVTTKKKLVHSCMQLSC